MTTTRGAGHFGPMRPFAHALRRGGHDVLVAAPTAAAAMVERAGLDHWTLAEAEPAERGAIFARTAGASSEKANAIVIGDLFAGVDAAAALPGILAATEEWRPDVILHESCEFGATLAAELAGVPTVRISIGAAALEPPVARSAAASVDRLRGEWGLPPDPDGARIFMAPAFTLWPRALEDPVQPGTAVRFREPLPAIDAPTDGGPPLVYASFGSVAGQMDFFPGLYLAAIEQLAPLPVRVLLTTGGAHDPAELGVLPANVRAEHWVDEHSVLPAAAAMVSHGGAGSVRAALSHGVPLAVVPLFAEQPQNAQAVAAAGAGLALDGPAGLRAAVGELLEQPAHRRVARAIAAEIGALPAVDEAGGALEGYLSLNARMRSSYWSASRA